jgi:two-component system, chemotaxis family, response regulator Rcp1
MAFEILVVEDNPTDVELVSEALRSWKTPARISFVKDGDEAMRFLRRSGPFSSVPSPNLILLDLNLPKMSGVQVLQEIKSDPELSKIPVIVLTTSDRESDVSQAYGLHANCYLTKPLDIATFFNKVKAIEDFWIGHARLPRSY